MSEPRAIYEAMLQEDLTPIERKVFEALKTHPRGCSREQLVAICFGEMVRKGSTNNNNGKDRRVRAAIASLRGRMVPILSGSRKAGYQLDVSDEGRRAMLGELIKKRNTLNDLIDRTAKMYKIPAEFPTPEIATQKNLL